MLVAFELSMPSRNSWDGNWSGDGRPFVRVKNLRKAQQVHVADGGYWHYAFGDGWAAGVSARVVDAAEARKLRRKTAGFDGYDWMIADIIEYGRIRKRVYVKNEGRYVPQFVD